ncbi:ligase-associated DNA damage response DEXH box helicase [Sphingopyxis alaskensis]|uniref:DEAD/DEAH box helicase-like protein n=1 Tax=Sphingopyxis alaskensis (strain DSM 13593 / LMG 18877 / RB2256) TaxID=317655 RepID=Q1GNP2_SPHAL|nr:ligase-associated DNA damage response DEXH box helicase [Sphingopyxis alaskensis]ABF54730.1 DEAD/DEAH box helicase-like protein [Sphingopyxis alaskensis RB2256]MCM3418429.1 ligase-associated DNA damage response DEXH box helicase [Sphingopyxis alaskensis]
MRLPAPFADWFAARGWRLRRHQADMLAAAGRGDHALLVAATGAGKTLAGFLPSLVDLAARPSDRLHTLYVSPLKALAADVERNLLGPIADMGLGISVESRSGDTSSDKKARQRSRPPNILLTTPESLSLLLSWPDSFTMFADLKTVVIDEIHAFAPGKRGDLLSLALARLQKIAPDLRRVGLSATIADPDQYRAWLAPDADADKVALVAGEAGADPAISILLPEGAVPWAGHSGRWAVHQVMAEVAKNRTTIIFCNTRGLAELIFQELWKVNDLSLPIAIHHGSLDREARQRAEAAMAEGRLRALVATSSLDLGLDWGDVDCVIQMGAPKGASRLLQRIGRANHRLDEPSRALIVPGNRFEYLEARAALDAVEAGERDADRFRPGALDVLAQHVMALACAAPFQEEALLAEIRGATPYRWIDADVFARLLGFVRDGGYALKSYDRFLRLAPDGPQGPDRGWRIAHPRLAAQHRLNAGIIVDAPTLDVRFKNGRRLGSVEEYFASTLVPGDTFAFAGLSLEVESIRDSDLIVRATTRPARIPSYMGARMALSTRLADRVRGFLADPASWSRFPADVRFWLEMQQLRSALPRAGELLVESFPHEGLHYLVAYPFEGWNAHQSLGMLVTKRMDRAGLQPMGFVASDYALAIWSLRPVTAPERLFDAEILSDEFVEWVENSHLLKRAFREVAVIGGLIARQHPGKRKTGKQVTFSTDLIFDVLRKYEPDHLLLEAAWADARARLTDVGRLGDLLDRAAGTMRHVTLDRISPLAIPVLVLIGRESVAASDLDDALLGELADTLARTAMRAD